MPPSTAATKHISPAPVIWITGVSGAGKTSIGQVIYELACSAKRNTVFLDGDRLREVVADDLGHTLLDRRRSAMRNSRLCKLVSDQGINVICPTISLFHSCQRWNRDNIPGYVEVVVNAPPAILRSRDPKRIYARFDAGEISDVVGLDLPAEFPLNPDIEIFNDGNASIEHIGSGLFERLKDRLV